MGITVGRKSPDRSVDRPDLRIVVHRRTPDLDPTAARDERTGAGNPIDADDVVIDVAAWERYLLAYDTHADRLFRVALLLFAGRRADAEDAVQEVFIAAHDPWRHGRVDDLGSYLRRSLTNLATSKGRHRTVVDRHVAGHRADDDVVIDVSDAATNHVAIQTALNALPARQRAAVVLRYYDGCSIGETASLLGVAPGTVKSQVSHGLRRMRTVLEVGR